MAQEYIGLPSLRLQAESPALRSLLVVDIETFKQWMGVVMASRAASKAPFVRERRQATWYPPLVLDE